MTEQEVQLKDYLRRLEDLNPEISVLTQRRMNEAASAVGSPFFGEASAAVERLILLYLNSPAKRQGALILGDYFRHLEQDAARLLAAGEIAAPVENASDCRTMALVPKQSCSALDRCIVLNRGTVPSLLAKAADAFRRRNEMVSTVMEVAFRLLWRIDHEQADRWFVSYFQSHEGDLDPDVIRDALTVALEQPSVSQDYLTWSFRWCGDAGLLEHWPIVVAKSDRLLCRHAVRAWLASHPPRTTSMAHLQLMFTCGKLDDESLLKWIQTALGNVGECVLRMMSFCESMTTETERERLQGALLVELRRLNGLFPAVLLIADQLLNLPDGSVLLAMAVMGLAGQGLKQWDDQLLEFCRKVIRRTFIMDMRAGRSPLDTIERLTFGDKKAFFSAYAELDLVSERFDSMKQREKVIELLAPFYASFRQAPLLAAETTRRYRKLRWMLHEDFLKQALTAEQYEEVEAMPFLRELAAMTGEARRFLGKQRDLESHLENILASKIEFEEGIRERRLRVARMALAMKTSR